MYLFHLFYVINRLKGLNSTFTWFKLHFIFDYSTCKPRLVEVQSPKNHWASEVQEVLAVGTVVNFLFR